ncbi:hypothetical protein GNP92_22930 [Paenibacillus timonensis]|nr:hypothetical protein [Paenibacillus timonensis]MUG89178.1 hypothetical protein [Paenibacillus timonensis]
MKVVAFSFKNKLLMLLLLLSTIMFSFFLLKNYNVNYYDETNYIEVSQQILLNGLTNLNEPLRTYLYPLLIAIISVFTQNFEVVKIVMSIMQFLFYIFTIHFVAKSVYSYKKNNYVFYGVIAVGFLNPYLVQSTTLLLTDIMATCCLTIAVFHTIFNDFSKKRDYYIVFILSYAAIMIRPSSLIIFPLLIVVMFMRKLMLKELNYFRGIKTAVFSSVMFLPQLYNNVKQFNDWTPLIHQDLYGFQSRLAATYLKYATVVIPNQEPGLIYRTPYNVSPDTTIYDLIFQQPISFVVTYIVHIFGALDWGYVDTYINDFYPFSRIIASIFLYSFWLIAFLGIINFFKKVKSAREKFIGISLLILFLGYALFIGTTVVESRFGYPLFLFLIPFFGYFIWLINEKSELKIRKRNKTTVFVYIALFLVYLSAIFTLSFYLDLQTDRINWINQKNSSEQFQLTNKFDKEVKINGQENWGLVLNARGYKIIQSSSFSYLPQDQYKLSILSSKEELLVFSDELSKPLQYSYRFWEEQPQLLITIPNDDTGWKDDYVPTSEDITRFFEENSYKLYYMLN